MPDAPTPLDLDAIRARSDAAIVRWELRTLEEQQALREVQLAALRDLPRLITEVDRLRAEVRLAWESARSAGLALGARLTARPAPAWDEDAAALAIFERSHEPPFSDDEAGMREAREFIRTVVRDHQPVKPSRETQVDAVLDLLPGRSEAEVRADERAQIVAMLDADIDELEQEREDNPTSTGVMRSVRLINRRARLAAEGGANRG